MKAIHPSAVSAISSFLLLPAVVLAGVEEHTFDISTLTLDGGTIYSNGGLGCLGLYARFTAIGEDGVLVGANPKVPGAWGFNGGPQPIMNPGDSYTFTLHFTSALTGVNSFSLASGWEGNDYSITTDAGIIDASGIVLSPVHLALTGDGTNSVYLDNGDTGPGGSSYSGTFSVSGPVTSISISQLYNDDRSTLGSIDNAAGLGFQGAICADCVPEPHSALLAFGLGVFVLLRRSRQRC